MNEPIFWKCLSYEIISVIIWWGGLHYIVNQFQILLSLLVGHDIFYIQYNCFYESTQAKIFVSL